MGVRHPVFRTKPSEPNWQISTRHGGTNCSSHRRRSQNSDTAHSNEALDLWISQSHIYTFREMVFSKRAWSNAAASICSLCSSRIWSFPLLYDESWSACSWNTPQTSSKVYERDCACKVSRSFDSRFRCRMQSECFIILLYMSLASNFIPASNLWLRLSQVLAFE